VADAPGAAGALGAPGTLYERVGGVPWFDALVERFYDGVAGDEVLRPLYPEDLTESKAHMSLFLAQYWGGPPAYNEQRGHPRLRMRHVPFAIGQPERDAWVRHMLAAVRGGGLDPDDEAAMVGYFEMAATHLVNHEPERRTIAVRPAPIPPAGPDQG
jgi:hemoglobin